VGAGPQRERLDSSVFRLPVDRIRTGYYSDAYFNHAKTLLESRDSHPEVLMQVFARRRGEMVLGGIDEAIAILRECSGRATRDGGWELGWDALEVRALYEGDAIAELEPVLTISGDYSLFAHLETVYLGCLARRTAIMTNVRDVVEAAAGKPILYFPARHDHWLVQTGDGWAAHVAGAIGVSTDAQASWWGGRGMGTIPHGLIAAFGGDTVAAALAFADRFAGEMNVTVLVDFDNDSLRTALEVAKALGPRLWGVRLDTAGALIDRTLIDEAGTETVAAAEAAATAGPDATSNRDSPPAEWRDLAGVSPQLAHRVRDALDGAGFDHVRIVASGGFSVERIKAFERAGVPVDAYGVGSALLAGRVDFTADVVRVDGRPLAKVGRSEWRSERLEMVH
jgi:nicotinate phosphoribosyltransferase